MKTQQASGELRASHQFRQQRQLWGVGLYSDEHGLGERIRARVEAGDVKVDVKTGEKGATPDRADATKFEYRQLSHVQGMKVIDKDNKEIGQLKDVMIDMHRGLPVFGIIGYGEKLAPVPWTEIHVGFENKDVAHINMDQSKLDTVAFTNDKWPDWSSQQTIAGIYEKFGEEPYWEVHGFLGEDRMGRMNTEGWQEGSAYQKLFSKDNVVTVAGTVQNVSTFTPAPNSMPGLRLRVKLSQPPSGLSDVVTVHGGPTLFAQEQNFTVKPGDELKIVAAKVTMPGGRNVLIARELTKGNQTLTLRDEDGKPKWDINKLRQEAERYNSDQPKTGEGG